MKNTEENNSSPSWKIGDKVIWYSLARNDSYLIVDINYLSEHYHIENIKTKVLGIIEFKNEHSFMLRDNKKYKRRKLTIKTK